MPVTTALSSFGTLLQAGDGAGTEVFTTITEVHDIDGPGFELGTVEVTHHLSPDAFREHMATLKDMTDVTFEVSFVPTDPTHDFTTGLLGDLDDRTRRNFRMVFTDVSTTWQWAGFITSFSISAQLENVYLGNVTIKCTGGVTEV